MKRTVFAAMLLLVCPVWAVPGQQSGGMKISVRGGDTGQTSKKNTEQGPQPLTNDSIVKLVKSGLGEETVISIVNTQPGKYSLGVDDILTLKKTGVSEKIITAMLNKSASGSASADVNPTSTVEKQDKSVLGVTGDLALQTDSDVPVPKDHGLYYQAPNRLVPIEGQVISFSRSGSRLASTVTFGVKSAKINVQLLGETSGHIAVSRPTFYYRAAQGTEAAGGAAGDLVLVKMTVKQRRRQFEVAAAGAWRSSQGISVRSQLEVVRRQIGPDLYRLTPTGELAPGEYGFYLFRGYDLPGFVYGFSVD